MKVSVNIAKWYSDTAQWQLPVAELAKKVGAQLGAVEEVIDLAGKYDGAIVAEISEAKAHPDADKLGVYMAYDGKTNTQVVCGDRNLKVGDKVAWLKPGTTVPQSWGTKEPFVLTVRPMRGIDSNGMFASGKELDVNDDHSRVLVLDTDKPAGTPFAEAYDMAGDAIIDIENKMFTHRPDCFGQLGVAREIAGIQHIPFASPDWYAYDAIMPESATHLTLSVHNDLPKLVPRFVALAMDGIAVSPSPVWLQAALHKLGIRPINNIVDITNYYMVVTGQPLHAYDYDKVAKLAGGEAKLTVRHPKEGETITLLNGKQITPNPKAMMVAAGDTLVCVGGMIGGTNSEVDEHTTRIILEAATWDMYSIRRTSMQHGIFTDAVTRFSKGQSPLQNVAVMAKAAEEIVQIAGGTFGSSVDDVHVQKDALARGSVYAPIVTTAAFINSRLGSSLTAGQIATLLGNVEFNVEEHGEELVITAPFWRTDIEIPEDVVEEVGRLHGFEHLTHNLPQRDTRAVESPDFDVLKSRVRTILSRAGANELQTYSFVPARLLQQVGQDKAHAFAIRNALSPELEHYRLSLTPNLLDKVHANIKAGYKEFALFEMNKIHIKGDDFVDCDGLPREYQTIAFVFASDNALPGAAYYYAKQYLDLLLRELGVAHNIKPVEHPPVFEIGRQVMAPFEQKRTGYVYVGEGEFGGFVGEYRSAVIKNLKLPKVVAGFEIDIERLLKTQHARKYQPLLKFPETEQDVCLKVASDVTYAELEAAVRTGFVTDERLRVTVSPLDIYQREEEKTHKQITYRLTLQHHDRTLTTQEVNDMLDSMVQKVAATVGGAERI